MNGWWAARPACRYRAAPIEPRPCEADGRSHPRAMGSAAKDGSAQPATSCAWVGLVRVAAHHPDQAGDVLLVPALAVDLVRVSVAGEEPADHLPQVLVAAGLAACLRRLDAGAHRLSVLSAAGAGAALPCAIRRALQRRRNEPPMPRAHQLLAVDPGGAIADGAAMRGVCHRPSLRSAALGRRVSDRSAV